MIRVLLFLGINVLAWSQMSFTGVVKPRHDIKLAFPIDGLVEQVFVREGDSVAQHTNLIALKDELQALEMQRRKLIVQQTGRLEFLRQRETTLEDLLEKTKRLYQKTRSVSQDELMQLELKLLETRGDRKSIEQTKKKEELEVEISKAALKQYTLQSPIEGIVTQIALEKGEWARAGEAIIRVIDQRVCTVDINVGVSVAHRFANDPDLQIRSKASGENVSRPARVVFLSPIADQASGLVLIRAEFDNADAAITPGSAAEIVLN